MDTKAINPLYPVVRNAEQMPRVVLHTNSEAHKTPFFFLDWTVPLAGELLVGRPFSRLCPLLRHWAVSGM